MTDHDTADGARRLSAIVFSDIVSYSKMMGEDEGNAMRVLQEHNELLVPMIQKARGRILKFMGDGIMSAFDSASDAVLCGVEIQKAVAERNKALPQKNHFLLRIGIHIGDVTEKNGDIFGDGVNIAARIQPLADPGGICISQTVYDIVRARREIRMVSLGPRELKNIKEAVHIYKVDVGDGLAASPAKAASWGAIGGGVVVLAAAGVFFVLRPKPKTVQVTMAPIVIAQKAVETVAPKAEAAPERGQLAAAKRARSYSSPHLDLAWKRYGENQPEMALDALAKEPADGPGAARAHELRALLFDQRRSYLDAAGEYLAAAEKQPGERAMLCRLQRWVDLKRAGRDADGDLRKYLESAPASPIGKFLLGKEAESKAAAAARNRPASYFLGMHWLLKLEGARGGDPNIASYLKNAQKYFQEAVDAGSEDSVEFQRAKFELARMRQRGDL